MNRLVRQARPALRAVRAMSTSTVPPARPSQWWKYAIGGIAVGAALSQGVFKFDPEREHRLASAHQSSSNEHSDAKAAIVDALHDAAAHADEDSHGTTEGEAPAEGEGSARVAPYDPETGEFNWDCPCLGGIPDTVCGEQFKTSFRCFVLSEAEPKGMDCIDAFNAMQQCFREHPEVYSREIDIYDEIDKEEQDAAAAAVATTEGDAVPVSPTHAHPPTTDAEASPAPPPEPTQKATPARSEPPSTPPKDAQSS